MTPNSRRRDHTVIHARLDLATASRREPRASRAQYTPPASAVNTLQQTQRYYNKDQSHLPLGSCLAVSLLYIIIQYNDNYT